MNNSFLWMSLVCSVLVVFKHTYVQLPFGSLSWWLNRTLFNSGLSEIAVPYFFFASGYFLAKHVSSESQWWGNAVMKRLRTLGVPFVCWNVLFAVFLFVVERIGVEMRSVGGLPGVSEVFARCLGYDIWHNPMLSVLWYVRALFVFVCLSALIGKVVANKGLGLSFCMFLYVVMVLAVPHLVTEDESAGYIFTRVLPLTGLFFFSFGMYVRRLSLETRNLRGGASMIVGLFIVVLLAIKVWLEVCDMGMLSRIFLLLVLPFVMLAVLFMMPNVAMPKSSLARFPFPLYVMHPFGLCVANGIVALVGIREMVQHSLLLSAVVSLGVVLVSFGVMIVTRRCLWLSSLLYGGR